MISLLLAAAILSADENSAEPELPRVEVVATPILQEERILKNGAEVCVLTRSQLENINAQDLPTALRQVPGVTISRYSAIGGYGGGQGGSIFIRGLGVSRPGGELRVYSDGAPRESGVWSHPLMDANPVDFAEAVRVVKVAHPGLVAGAFAAVETETRRRACEGCEAEANLAYGRYNTFLSSISGGGMDGSIDAYAGVAYKRSDGHRDHSAASLDNAFFRVGDMLADWAYIAFVYSHTDSSVEDPGFKGMQSPVFDRFDLRTDLYNLRLDIQREEIEGYSLLYFEHGDIAWRKDHLTDGVLSSPPGTADTAWLNFGTRHRYTVNFKDDWRSVLALDLERDGGHTANKRFSDNRRVFGFKGDFLMLSGYGALEKDVHLNDEWTLTPSAGVRMYYHNCYANEFAPTGAVVLDYDEKVALFVQSSRAVHYPGIYTRALSDDFAKGVLSAETMNTISSGVKAMPSEETEVKLSFFRNEIDNRISRLVNGYVNEGEVDTHGIELSFMSSIAKSWSVYGGATWTKAENCRASRMPELTLTAASAWEVCKYLKWIIDAQYIGSMYSYSTRNSINGDMSESKLADGFLFNTRFSVPLESICSRKGEIYLSVENFTNRHYEYYPGYPIGGIMWYLGCRMAF